MAGKEYGRAISVVGDIAAAGDLRAAFTSCARGLGELLHASRVVVGLYPQNPQNASPAQLNGRDSQPPIEWSTAEPSDAADRQLFSLLAELEAHPAGLSAPFLLGANSLDTVVSNEAVSELALSSLAFAPLMASADSTSGRVGYLLVTTDDAGEPLQSADLELIATVARALSERMATAPEGAEPQAERTGAEVSALFVDSDGIILGAEPSFERSAGVRLAPLVGRRLSELVDPSAVPVEEQRYGRLVEHSDALIFNTDAEHRIIFISRRAVEYLGIEPADLMDRREYRWFDLIHPEDRERVVEVLEKHSRKPRSFDEEFRIVNHVTGRVRWLLTKLVPVWNREEELLGWDGFAINITARKEAQAALDQQSRKVRALYTVSSAIRGFLDPANIAARGLTALCDATGAEAGLCYLYPSRHAGALSLVSHHGFSAGFAERTDSASTLHTLSTYVAEHGQSIVVPDIRTDPRAANKMLADEEGVRSALLVPISVEDEILGTLGLFHREASRFDGGDVMLASAAANQIGLAARQASLFAAYRRQTKNLSALYRLSHELSGFLSLDEIFQKAFEVIRDELGLKRLWLGLLNETGTRIIGQAAYGPGWKRRLVEINVEVQGRDHPIAQVINTRKPMIIDDPDKVLSEFGVRRFFSRFAISSVGLVPLVSGGQVLGAIAFQPGADDPQLDEEEITLLSSLASEIAACLLAKRLEERVGEGEKMRSTGLLAAGIAHNFNNLLQAIMGQASLLEMQGAQSPDIMRAATIIGEAATKGASLVRQLMSFANLEEPSKEVCEINAVIERGISSLKRQLGSGQTLTVTLGESLPLAHVDPRQLLRILTVLVTNAHEAMDHNGIVQIFTDSITVDRESPHFEVPYGDYVRIGVRDNGVGMDAEAKRRCFEPFFTTKDVDPSSGLSLSGAGLGLAAAYALARKNGGRLVVDSRKGHGSLFTVYVPVAEGQSAGRERPDAASEESGDGSLKVEVEQLRSKSDLPQLPTIGKPVELNGKKASRPDPAAITGGPEEQ